MIPALQHRTWRPAPHSGSLVMTATAFLTDSKLMRSQSTCTALPLTSTACSASSARAEGLFSISTVAPFSAATLANTRPVPEVLPVTATTFPCWLGSFGTSAGR